MPAGFRDHCSQPDAALPLTVYISHACPFSLQCQPLLALPATKLPPPPCLFGWFPPIWRPHWVPRATQPLGNSNRWGGTASLTDGPTEAGLFLHSSLGNRRQELSHHGRLLNRTGGGGGRASCQPQTPVTLKRNGFGGAGQWSVYLPAHPAFSLGQESSLGQAA